MLHNRRDANADFGGAGVDSRGQAFVHANDVLKNAVGAISDIIRRVSSWPGGVRPAKAA